MHCRKRARCLRAGPRAIRAPASTGVGRPSARRELLVRPAASNAHASAGSRLPRPHCLSLACRHHVGERRHAAPMTLARAPHAANLGGCARRSTKATPHSFLVASPQKQVLRTIAHTTGSHDHRGQAPSHGRRPPKQFAPTPPRWTASNIDHLLLSTNHTTANSTKTAHVIRTGCCSTRYPPLPCIPALPPIASRRLCFLLGRYELSATIVIIGIGYSTPSLTCSWS
jgi:hypothetical protein